MKSFLSRLKLIVNNIHLHPLAKRHKFLAYSKLIFWQVSQTIIPKERKILFTKKTSLLVKKGMTGATGNIYLGLHEFNDMAFLLHFLRPEDLFFDIGANVGSYTVLASGHCGAFTVCFEPIPSTYKALHKNIIVNNIEHLVLAKNIGVGECEGFLTFTNNMDTVNHVVNSNNNYQKDVALIPVLTADSFVVNNKIPQVVKIDVEGFETFVLNGMKNILNNSHLKAIIIELNGSCKRYDMDENEIHQKLLGLGFFSYSYKPFTREIIHVNTPGPSNTIYIRDLSFVKKRIENAQKINIFSESF